MPSMTGILSPMRSVLDGVHVSSAATRNLSTSGANNASLRFLKSKMSAKPLLSSGEKFEEVRSEAVVAA